MFPQKVRYLLRPVDRIFVLKWLSLGGNSAEQSPGSWRCPIWAAHGYDLEELGWERGWEKTDLWVGTKECLHVISRQLVSCLIGRTSYMLD